MPEQPYTDDDLRTAAATQLADLATDPDFMGIGERMEGNKIASRGDYQWDQLDEDDWDIAVRKVDNLLSKAADLSDWAVNLGADGLEPDEAQLTFSAGPKPIVRIHFAFDPGLSGEARDSLVQGIGDAAAQEMQRAAEGA